MDKTTCQICGRPIKSKLGVIAHHGYQRPGNGWQTSSCMGARHLPYEQSCDLIPEAINGITEYVNREVARLEDWKLNPPDYLWYTPYRGAGRKREEQGAIKVERPADFKFDGRRTYRIGAYDTIYHDNWHKTEQEINHSKSYIDFLTRRLADWKPPVMAVDSMGN